MRPYRLVDADCHTLETDVGWIPAALEQLDHFHWDNRATPGCGSAGFRRSCRHDYRFCTFICDRVAIQNRYDVGVRNMPWSTDYPHHGNDWPYSRKRGEQSPRRTVRSPAPLPGGSTALGSGLRATSGSHAAGSEAPAPGATPAPTSAGDALRRRSRARAAGRRGPGAS